MTIEEITKRAIKVEIYGVEPSRHKLNQLGGDDMAKYALSMLKKKQFEVVLDNGSAYKIPANIAKMLKVPVEDHYTENMQKEAADYGADYTGNFGIFTKQLYQNDFVKLSGHSSLHSLLNARKEERNKTSSTTTLVENMKKVDIDEVIFKAQEENVEMEQKSSLHL